MNTINWIIESFVVALKSGDLEKVVVTANWRANANDGAGHFATAYGCATFSAPDPTTFKPFDDLQPEDVLGWIFAAGVDKAAIEANLAKQIADQVNPPLVILVPRWNQPIDVPVDNAQASEAEPVTEAAPEVLAGE